jgi:hypothetical protein
MVVCMMRQTGMVILIFCVLLFLAGPVYAFNPTTPAENATILQTESAATAAEQAAANAVTFANTNLANERDAAYGFTIPVPTSLLAGSYVNALSNSYRNLAGSGVTDDTGNLQTLINDVPAGTAIYFPAGTYLLAGTVSTSKSLTLFGTTGTVFECTKNGGYYYDLTFSGNNVLITGIKFIGAGEGTYPTVVYFNGGNNEAVTNSVFNSTGEAAIEFHAVTGGMVNNVLFADCYGNDNTDAAGYGVAISDNSDNITIRNSYFTIRGRHSVMTGSQNAGTTEYGSWPKNVYILNNYMEGVLSEAVNNHPQTDGPVYVENNTIVCPQPQTYDGQAYPESWGIVLGSGGAGDISRGDQYVINNTLYNCNQAIWSNYDYSRPTDNRVIANNTVILNQPGSSYSKLIFVQGNSTVVENNTIVGNSGTKQGIYVVYYQGGDTLGLGNRAITNVSVLNNFVQGAYDNIYVQGAAGYNISDITITGNVVKSTGTGDTHSISLTYVTNAVVNNNIIKNFQTSD